MKRASTFNTGIPVAPSLGATLEAEDLLPKKKVDRSRILKISFMAVLIAIVISVLGKFLIYLIALITNISFYGSFSISPSGPSGNSLGLFVIVVPALGGIIVGLMALYGSKAIRGHGIPEAMEQILTNQSKVKPTITYLKPLSSAISIGTGGPFGAEGPIIATGGALGSTIGQILRISDNERKVLLAAGATAGMAAIFGSPIAAVFLAIELLLFEFSPRSLIPVSIACMVGAAGHHLLFGHGPVFEMGTIATPSTSGLFVCGIIGLVIGGISVFVSKAVYYVEEGFEKLPVHWMWWPAIGGLVVGVVGYISPRTLGVGYENITDVLSGTLTMQVILSLCIFKFISWAIALGSGTSGGTLAPLLTIGGAAGALIGMFILEQFPASGITIPLAALVGMAAMFAGASRALLTSIIFAAETTLQSNAMLPLLVACVAAYLVSFFLMEHTIMTEKIARRGVVTPQSYEPDILERITVEHVLSDRGIVISENNSIKEVREWLGKEREQRSNHFIVTDRNGVYKGLLNSLDLFSDHLDPEDRIDTLRKTHHVTLSLTDDLRSAAEAMAKGNTDVLPVISGMDNSIIGILSYHDIIATYKHGVEEHETKRPHISLKRRSLKILLQGQKIASLVQGKGK